MNTSGYMEKERKDVSEEKSIMKKGVSLRTCTWSGMRKKKKVPKIETLILILSWK